MDIRVYELREDFELHDSSIICGHGELGKVLDLFDEMGCLDHKKVNVPGAPKGEYETEEFITVDGTCILDLENEDKDFVYVRIENLDTDIDFTLKIDREQWEQINKKQIV